MISVPSIMYVKRTLTCYNGIIGDGCGECPACKLRKAGLDRYLEQRTDSASVGIVGADV